MRKILNFTLALALVAGLWPSLVGAGTYRIDPGDKSEIVFVSKATLDSFKGRTHQVSGWFEADLDQLAGSVLLDVTVDLASFDTGIGKRNQHMRDNHLETEKYPTARFTAGTVVSAEPGSLGPGQQGRLTLHGTLDLHGVQKEMDCELTVHHRDDGTVLVQGEFPVSLNDFAIDRPKFLVMKLADEQQVQLDLVARPGQREEAQ